MSNLTNSEKIEILSSVRGDLIEVKRHVELEGDPLDDEVPSPYICDGILDRIPKTWNKPLKAVPELLDEKPEGVVEGLNWWTDDDMDSRITAIDNTIERIKLKGHDQ